MDENMKKEKRITSGIRITAIFAATMIIALAAFSAGRAYGAQDGEAGSAGDPLITKSYLDLRLSELSQSGGFKYSSLDKGYVASFGAGSRFVLYSGTATAKGNLVDLTDGKMLKNGADIEKFHEYLTTSDNSGATMKSSGLLFYSE